MSAGQRPRTPIFYPKMKDRARKRRRGQITMTIYDECMRPVWPQVLTLHDGRTMPLDVSSMRMNGRRPDGTFWIDANV